MTQRELIEQLASEFKANSARRNHGRRLPAHGPTGPLNIPTLPHESVDAIEAAIVAAFELVDEEPSADYGHSES